MNSTFGILQRELLGLTNLGGGGLKFSGDDIGLFLIPKFETDVSLKKNFILFASQNATHIDDKFLTATRVNLDNAIFDLLKLSKRERDAVYEAVFKLVNDRLNKADSL